MEISFTPKELHAMVMGLNSVIEDCQEGLTNPLLPWTPEARADLKDILAYSKSALEKVGKITGKPTQMPGYKAGDEDAFLTKES